MNKIRGYRNMLGKTQRDMAKIFNISVQSYNQKEHGKIAFKDSEKTVFKNMLLPYFPNITIDDIFLQTKFDKFDFNKRR